MKFLEESFTDAYFCKVMTFCEYIEDIIYWGNDCNITYLVLNCCESCIKSQYEEVFYFFSAFNSQSFISQLCKNKSKQKVTKMVLTEINPSKTLSLQGTS